MGFLNSLKSINRQVRWGGWRSGTRQPVITITVELKNWKQFPWSHYFRMSMLLRLWTICNSVMTALIHELQTIINHLCRDSFMHHRREKNLRSLACLPTVSPSSPYPLSQSMSASLMPTTYPLTSLLHTGGWVSEKQRVRYRGGENRVGESRRERMWGMTNDSFTWSWLLQTFASRGILGIGKVLNLNHL